MTGFIGVFNWPPAKVERPLIAKLTNLMERTCPDGSHTWCKDNVGLGTAFLSLTHDAEDEHQPLSLHDEVHIIGDVRLDRRAELAAKLSSTDASGNHSDVALVLRAYHRWGSDCIDHISGDYAFAIWDAQQHRLFCARDHFGVVPLYFAHLATGIIVSSHLQCLLAHPEVPDTFNETALGDFLLFSMNLDRETTVYSSISKLPPGHTLTWNGGSCSTQRYWDHSTDVDIIHYKRKQDYVDHFVSIFERSVSDRLRTNQAATHLSGGLDSTSIAAVAKRLGSLDRLQAYNITYRQLLREDEGRLAKNVADHIKVPLEFLFAEDFIGAPPSNSGVPTYPEPHIIPSQVAEVEISRRVAFDSRVLLAGFGGDPALFPPEAPFKTMLNQGQVSGALFGLFSVMASTGRLPRPGLRTKLRKMAGKDARTQIAKLPGWVDKDFAKETDLAARLSEAIFAKPVKTRAGMASEPLWSNIFAWSHPGFSGQPLKTRFPFFDLELITFLERIPPVPWLQDKILLREAMRGILPDEVRRRSKSPLPGSGQFNHYKRDGATEWQLDLANSHHLDRLVDRQKLVSLLLDHTSVDHISYRQTVPVLHLAYWFTQLGE